MLTLAVFLDLMKAMVSGSEPLDAGGAQLPLLLLLVAVGCGGLWWAMVGCGGLWFGCAVVVVQWSARKRRWSFCGRVVRQRAESTGVAVTAERGRSEDSSCDHYRHYRHYCAELCFLQEMGYCTSKIGSFWMT